MVGATTLLAPSKERNDANRQCDDAWNTCDCEKPSESNGEPCVPMNDTSFMKNELRIVVPSDVHHRPCDKHSDEADNAEREPTEMDSTRLHHLTRQSSATADGRERCCEFQC